MIGASRGGVLAAALPAEMFEGTVLTPASPVDLELVAGAGFKAWGLEWGSPTGLVGKGLAYGNSCIDVQLC